ncbi:MAG: BamA/TamA family outer membrane protein [Rikenellaceae bacterium]
MYRASQNKTIYAPDPISSPRALKQYERKLRRDSIRAKKKVWLSILGGPSYTPEASIGIGGALLASFRLSKNDSVSQRSFLPIGFNLSLNGTVVIAGGGTLFFNENRFRIYASYGYRNEPANYYGKGYESIKNVHMSDSTTGYKKESIQFYPRFVWEVKKHLYVGTLLDINYARTWKINPVMAADPYFNQFRQKFVNVGLGAIVQYDTRNDVATPFSGLFLSAIGKVYGKYAGGRYNYQMLDLEYRQFQPLFRRATLAWTARSQIGFNDVPFTELPTFGSPNDLRGYYVGQYRDKSMAYGIVEFRHMFGTHEDYERGRLLSRFGYVLWGGTGTIGNTPANWDRWKFNYGAGLRIQIQPGKNFRLDVGKAHGVKGVLIYFNMTEAF